MESDGSIFSSLVILSCLVMTNAFFAMSEIAVLSANPVKIRRCAEGGDQRAFMLMRMTESPSGFLATIQVGVTLSGMLASAVAAEKFAGMLVGALEFVPVDKDVLAMTSLVVITIVLSFFTLIFGELVPKRLAMKHAEKISLAISGVLWMIYQVFRPFVLLLAASTNGILKLFGIAADDGEQPVTEEDILMMVDEGSEKGTIANTECSMIRNVFEFDDKAVRDVMTRRINIKAAEIGDGIGRVLAVARQNGCSRIPVYEGCLDDIKGILYIKDIIMRGNRSAKSDLTSYLREPVYVPETKLCSSLLRDFQDNRVHMAVVIDEYGGVSGIVTMEDLLEVIVGDIEDEYDGDSAA